MYMESHQTHVIFENSFENRQLQIACNKNIKKSSQQTQEMCSINYHKKLNSEPKLILKNKNKFKQDGM